MDRIHALLNNDIVKIVISVIWGLGIATMFRKSCLNRNCVVIKGPTKKELQDSYRYNKNCYKYIPEATECTNDAIELSS